MSRATKGPELGATAPGADPAGATAPGGELPRAGATAPGGDAGAHRGGLPSGARGARALVLYLLLGTYFGVVITKAEVVSWFRIQEMFRFQSFHMYGIIGSAVLVAALSVAIIRRAGVKSFYGEPIHIPPKAMGKGVRYLGGGTLFGVGWALTGACPGPLLALVGNGVTVMLVALASAILGTWTYGHLRPRLPH